MLDSDKITERVLGGDQKEDSLNIEGIVEDVVKSRVYVDDESEVPDQYDAQVSDSGAVYYETDSSGGGMVDEAVDHFEDFVEDIDVTDPQDEFEEEAAQLWSDYTQGMISEDEFDEQVVDFIEEYADETLE